MQNRNRLTDIETKGNQRGEGSGEEEIRGVRLANYYV